MKENEYNEAVQRFDATYDQMWESALNNIVQSTVMPAPMRNGQTDPVDYCISFIARLQSQPSVDVTPIIDLQEEFLSKLGAQFAYPTSSLHISLLGCTQRSKVAEDFNSERVNQILKTSRPILEKFGTVTFDLKGVNLSGNSIVIPALAGSLNWAQMRLQLAEAMREIGESPITYPDTFPAHMNILRLTHVNQERLTTLRGLLERNRYRDILTLKVRSLEFVRTDFIVSPAALLVFDRVNLTS